MKKLLIPILALLIASPAWAAQQNISTITTKTSREALRTAVNTELGKVQSNTTELYSLAIAAPWLAQTTAPSITNVFWVDTSGTSPVIKYWDGDSWEVAASGEGGTYTLPTASADTLGGVKVGARLTITDGVLSADVQSGGESITVGDGTTGPYLDGTSDGGTTIKLYGPNTYWTALQAGAATANRSWRLPIAAAPSAGTTRLMNMDEYGQMGFVDPATFASALGGDDNYVTDAEKTKLANLSGTNSGDNAVNSNYSSLVTNATHTGEVTGSGALTIANGAVTLAKMANMATGSLIYRKTASAGTPEVQTLATLKTDLGLTGTNSGDQTTITGNAGGLSAQYIDWNSASGGSSIANKPTLGTSAALDHGTDIGDVMRFTDAGTCSNPSYTTEATCESNSGTWTSALGVPFTLPSKADVSCFASESTFNACFDLTWATGGYTNLTSFVTQTNWRVFYSNGSGDVTELALGASGTVLKSNGASAAPTWEADNTAAGAGYVSTPPTYSDEACTAGQYAVSEAYRYDCVATGNWNRTGLTDWSNPTPTTPTLSSRVIGTNGTSLTLTGSASLSVGAGGNGGFDVDCSTAGNGITATYASGAPGSNLVYTLGTTVNSGDTCDLDYTQPGNGIEATTGGADLASITSGAITNNSTQSSGMATATDDFNRTNSGTLGSLSGGTYSWTQVTGDFDVESNLAQNIAGPSVAVLNPAVSQNAYTVEADVHDEDNGYSKPGLVFWYTDSNNYWRVVFDQPSAQQVLLEQVTAGTPTTRGTGGGNTYSSTTLYNMRVVTSGTSISVYFDNGGSPAVTHTATSAGSGNVGIFINRSSATGYIDDFSASN